MVMEQFIYNENQDWEANYYRWQTMNNDERFRHNQTKFPYSHPQEYTEEEAIEVFTKMYPKFKEKK